MNYLDIKDFDITNGEGIRVSLWVSGCEFRCKGCHNIESWDKCNGDNFGEEEKEYLFSLMNNRVEKNLSILGGEPLAEYNRDDVLELCEEFKAKFPNKNVWLWSGYTIKEIQEEFPQILKSVDVIICGRYVEELKVKHRFYGSSNQKLFNLPMDLNPL